MIVNYIVILLTPPKKKINNLFYSIISCYIKPKSNQILSNLSVKWQIYYNTHFSTPIYNIQR
jgi:hypothetical protein